MTREFMPYLNPAACAERLPPYLGTPAPHADLRLESAVARNTAHSKPRASPNVHIKNIALTLLFSLPSLALADTFNYVFITGDKNVGHLNAETKGDQTTIDFNVKNNGRGPTIAESITLDAA